MTPVLNDKRLNTVFNQLLEKLEASREAWIYLSSGIFPAWDAPTLDRFLKAGLVKESSPLSVVICDGCEQSCIRPVHIRDGTDMAPAGAFVVCHLREDTGCVPISLERLRQTCFSMETLVHTLGQTLAPDREAQEIIPGRLWFLGRCAFGRARRAVFLARGTAWPDASSAVWECEPFKQHDRPVIFTVSNAPVPTGMAAFAIGNLMDFRDDVLTLDRTMLATSATHPTKKDTYHIRHDHAEQRVLLNDKYILSRPRFDGENERVIRYLCQNPNRMIEFTELQKTCGKLKKPLHMIVYRLGFRGKLKDAFFTAGQNKLQFHNPIDTSSLAEHGIKAAEILTGLKTV